MALPSDKLTISYQQIASIPIGTRTKMASSGFAEAFKNTLTPGQIIALFPKSYREGIFASGGTQVASLTSPSYTPPASSPDVAGPYTPTPQGDTPKLTPAERKQVENAGIQPGLSAPARSGGGSPGVFKNKDEIRAYIRQAAMARGIDPDVAVRVADSEGMNGKGPGLQSTVPRNGKGSRDGLEDSWGPFQLYRGGGMGNEFEKKTGLDLTDPTTIQQQIDFALDGAAKNGWGAWNGAKTFMGDNLHTGIGPDAHPIGISDYGVAGTATPLTPEQIAFNEEGEAAYKAAHPEETATVVGETPATKAGDLVLGITDGRAPDLEHVDPKLKEIVAAAATHLPPGYKVTINDGFHEQGTDSRSSKSQHKVKDRGAIDVQILDPAGNVVPNKGDDPTGVYKTLATHAKGEMLARYPELEGKLAYGGAFETSAGSGKADPMHFDLGGDRGQFRPSNQIANLELDPKEQYGVAKIVEDASGLHIAEDVVPEVKTADTATPTAAPTEYSSDYAKTNFGDAQVTDNKDGSKTVTWTDPNGKEVTQNIKSDQLTPEYSDKAGMVDYAARLKYGLPTTGMVADTGTSITTLNKSTVAGDTLVLPSLKPSSTGVASPTGRVSLDDPTGTGTAQQVTPAPAVKAEALGASSQVAPQVAPVASLDTALAAPPVPLPREARPAAPASPPPVKPGGDVDVASGTSALNESTKKAFDRARGGDYGGPYGTGTAFA